MHDSAEIYVENEEDEIFNKDEDNEGVNSFASSSFRGRFQLTENTAIDPQLWQQETERVVPLLKMKEQSLYNYGSGMGSSWIMHLEALMKYSLKIGVASAGSTVKAEVDGGAASLTNLMAGVTQLQHYVDTELKKLKVSERLLSVNPGVSAVAADYSLYKTVSSSRIIQLRHSFTTINL